MPDSYFTIRNRPNSDTCLCDILDKEKGVREYVAYMFDRTASMFEYQGLPDTLPAHILEFYLQLYGIATIAEVNGELYVFNGRPGGPPDPYYRETQVVVANPGLNLSQEYRIINHFAPFDKSRWTALPPCVLMYNDTQRNGLMPLYSRYATQLTENDISLRCAQFNARQQTLIAGTTDAELASANLYIENLEKGKLATVAEAPFLSGIHAENVSPSSSNSIIQLIELQQYLKAAWFNDIGLNANFNMKREYLSAEEIATNTDILLPLADDMLTRRQEALDFVNQTFGTSITVKKNSAWEKKEEEVEVSLAQEQAAAGSNSNPTPEGGDADGD